MMWEGSHLERRNIAYTSIICLAFSHLSGFLAFSAPISYSSCLNHVIGVGVGSFALHLYFYGVLFLLLHFMPLEAHMALHPSYRIAPGVNFFFRVCMFQYPAGHGNGKDLGIWDTGIRDD